VSIALALGQIEEAIGLNEVMRGLVSEDSIGTDVYVAIVNQRLALLRARDYLATAAEAARVPVAHYTPITAKEVEEAAP
jgi:hypothetical protein